MSIGVEISLGYILLFNGSFRKQHIILIQELLLRHQMFQGQICQTKRFLQQFLIVPLMGYVKNFCISIKQFLFTIKIDLSQEDYLNNVRIS